MPAAETRTPLHLPPGALPAAPDQYNELKNRKVLSTTQGSIHTMKPTAPRPNAANATPQQKRSRKFSKVGMGVPPSSARTPRLPGLAADLMLPLFDPGCRRLNPLHRRRRRQQSASASPAGGTASAGGEHHKQVPLPENPHRGQGTPGPGYQHHVKSAPITLINDPESLRSSTR